MIVHLEEPLKQWTVFSKQEPDKDHRGVIIWWPEWDGREARKWFRENVEKAEPGHFYHGATLELDEFETREERIEKERDRYRAALEIIADRSTASITLHGTVETLRAHARAALNLPKTL